MVYKTEVISYKHNKYLACKSRNFLPEGWKLITLERLFQSLYGQHIHFFHNNETIDKLLREEPFYPEEIKNRVKVILMNQRRKYSYLFSSSAKPPSHKLIQICYDDYNKNEGDDVNAR